jgi:predicted secreted protein
MQTLTRNSGSAALAPTVETQLCGPTYVGDGFTVGVTIENGDAVNPIDTLIVYVSAESGSPERIETHAVNVPPADARMERVNQPCKWCRVTAISVAGATLATARVQVILAEVA